MGGFTNPRKVRCEPVNVGRLGRFEAGSEVSPAALAEAGLIASPREPVVILAHGDLERPLRVRAHRFSRRARSKILAAGGSVETLPLVAAGE